MKGSGVTFLGLLILISFTSSQITFSRSWVRGKYPGEDELVVGDGDASFLRAAKAELGDEPVSMYNRVPKSALTLNSRLIQDLLRKWKSPYSNRYKEYSYHVGDE